MAVDTHPIPQPVREEGLEAAGEEHQGVEHHHGLEEMPRPVKIRKRLGAASGRGCLAGGCLLKLMLVQLKRIKACGHSTRK